MHRPRKLPACFCALLLATPSAFGRQGSNCSQRMAIVGIAGDHGIVPPDLTSRNFTLTYGHGLASSPKAVYSEGPRRVMVLLDASGSMRGPEAKRHPKWEIAHAGARSLLTSLPVGSAAGLMTFAGRVEMPVPLSADHRLAEEWLDNNTADQAVSVKGRTAMYGAIEAAEKQLEPTQPGDAIYIITDAGENASKVRGSDVEKSLVAAGIRLFAFLLVSSGPRTEEETEGTTELQHLVDGSGGFTQVVWPKDAGLEQGITQGTPAYARTMQHPADSGLAFDNFTEEQIQLHANLLNRWISAFYILTFETPEGKVKPKHIDVEVIDSQRHTRKDLTLAYSRTLAPCVIVPAQH